MLIMTNRHKAFLLRAFLSILTATLWAQNDTSSRPEYLYEKEHPLRETRAVWLTTIGGLDWPRIWATDASSRERQKEELVRILDNYQRANINTVIFQTRVRRSASTSATSAAWSCMRGSSASPSAPSSGRTATAPRPSSGSIPNW